MNILILLFGDKAMIRRLQKWKIRHVRRNANEAAHIRAKRALVRRDDQLWQDAFPLSVGSL